MNMRFWSGVAVAACLCGPVAAQSPYHQALAELDIHARHFIQAQGHVSIAPDTLTGDQYYSERNFPGMGNRQAVSLPDADLDPLTRAILLLESREASLPHARYRIVYSMNASVDVPDAQHAYVDVTRFNVGPARRADLLMSVPDAQVAEPAEFGVGPHVSWRFVMMPMMGSQAGLVYAGRNEVSEDQARRADCLGEPCLSLVDPSGPASGWQPQASPRLNPPAFACATSLGVSSAACGMRELWTSMTAEGMDPLPYKPQQAHFVFVLSLNTGGQEAALAALGKQSLVLDASVSKIWTQRYEVAGVPAEFSTLYVSRR